MFRRISPIFRLLKLPVLKRVAPLALALPCLVRQLFLPYQCQSNSTDTQAEPTIETLPQFQMRDSFKHKHIIIYAKSGTKQIDDVVLMLLNIYVDLFPNPNLKVLVLENGPTGELPPGLTVIRRYSEDIAFIDLGYFYQEGTSIEEFYSKVCKHINKKLQETPIFKTVMDFTKTGLKPDNEVVVLLKTDSSQKNHVRNVVKLERFKKSAQVYERNTEFLIADGPEIAADLGLEDLPDGRIMLLVPQSSKNIKQNQGTKALKRINLEGIKYVVIPDAQKDQLILESFVFAPLVNQKFAYFATLRINRNKVDEVLEDHLYKQMASAHLPTRIIPSNEIDGWELVVNKNSDEIEQLFTTSTSGLKPEEIQKRVTEPREWKYSLDVLRPQFVDIWIKDIMDGTAPPNYRSETAGPYDRYSKKLTGETFHQILESQHDEAVFYYSEHCASCKRFGKVYENLAKNNPYKNYLRFNHMNNDKNKTPTGHNYGYTPVFAYFKKEYKQKPFVYKRPYFTEKAFREFLDITHEVHILAEDKFERCLQRVKENPVTL